MSPFSIIILAAGKGTRMNNPETPKVLAELNGKPLISYVLDTSLSLSPQNIYLIIGYKKELVRDYVAQNYKNALDKIIFVEQNKQLGTGHAVKQVEPVLHKHTDVLILAGDVPAIKASTLAQFIAEHRNQQADLSVLSAIASNPAGYGRIIRRNGNFLLIREEKDASQDEKLINEINSGIYFLNTELLFPALDKIKQNNAQREYYLTDIIEILKNEGKKVVATQVANFNEIQGVNTHQQLQELSQLMQA